MLVRSVYTGHACNFRDMWNESQPGRQLVEKLATTLPKTCYAHPDEDEAIPKIELKH